MATINFLYRSTKEKAPLTLRLLFRHNKEDFVFDCKTKYEIEKDYWKKDHFKNKKDATIKNKQVKVNKDLLEIENFVLDNFNKTNPSRINKKWLVEQINLYYNPPKEKQKSELVTDAIKNIIDNAHLRDNDKDGKGLSQCRINAYNRLLELFNKFQGENQYKVKELNKEVFDDFKKWLFDKQNYSNTYAFKKLSDLKTVCKDARANGIETSTELTDIKTKQLTAYDNDMDVIFLSTKEIEKIEKATLLKDAHINARKWLILACYTGQRGGDLIKITESNFKKTKNKECIELTQQKTNKKVEIPILPKVREIYNTGLPYKVSTQKLNKYFKEIGKLAEINTPTMGRIIEANEDPKIKKKRGVKKVRPKHKYISTHIGRRSFASNHYCKLPTPIIMKVTGHSKESTFLTYINQSDDSHIDAFLEYYKKEELKEKKETNLKVIGKKASNN
jgi:integrase